jgi:hypothetical protein
MGAIAFCVGGCVYPGAEVDVVGDPPVPIVEAVPPSPGIGLVWVGGAWTWNGRWVWEGGRWEHPPYRGAVWIGPRYVNRHGRHVFIRGHWK